MINIMCKSGVAGDSLICINITLIQPEFPVYFNFFSSKHENNRIQRLIMLGQSRTVKNDLNTYVLTTMLTSHYLIKLV